VTQLFSAVRGGDAALTKLVFLVLPIAYIQDDCTGFDAKYVRKRVSAK